MLKITAADVELFARFDGDLDALSRSGLSEKISYETWRLIDRLAADLGISRSVPTSTEFVRNLDSRLASSLADSAAKDALDRYVREH